MLTSLKTMKSDFKLENLVSLRTWLNVGRVLRTDERRYPSFIRVRGVQQNWIFPALGYEKPTGGYVKHVQRVQFHSGVVSRDEENELDKFIKSRRSRNSSFLDKTIESLSQVNVTRNSSEPPFTELEAEEKAKRLKMILSRKRRFLSPTLRIQELTGQNDLKET